MGAGRLPFLMAYGAISGVAFAVIDLAMFRAMLDGIDAAAEGPQGRAVYVLGMELAWGVGRVGSLDLLAAAFLARSGPSTLVGAAVLSALLQLAAARWLGGASAAAPAVVAHARDCHTAGDGGAI